jgi:hypothetical protein
MTDQELIKKLRQGWRFVDGQTISNNELKKSADRIEELTAKVKLFEKIEMYLKTSYPEKSGSYFICGEGGVKDDNDLPERLYICPAYGADWMMMYTRTDKTSGPEY